VTHSVFLLSSLLFMLAANFAVPAAGGVWLTNHLHHVPEIGTTTSRDHGGSGLLCKMIQVGFRSFLPDTFCIHLKIICLLLS
jgi:hypothetical protein